MAYEIDFGIWGGIFAVPTALCDRHLKFCSESQLKVLLLALRDAPSPVDVPYIAKRLGLPADQVCDCLEYWQQAGVFTRNEAPVAAVPAPAPVAVGGGAAVAVAQVAARTEQTGQDGQRITTLHSRAKLTPGQIHELCRTDPSIPWMMEELQRLFARPLSPGETETIVYLYSYLTLTPDYLLMAAEYCKSMGKLNMRYIEKLVTGWVDQGVDNHEKAERHILELGRRHSNEGLIRSLFGISVRELSSKEKSCIASWFDDFGFDTEVIRLAYERTVDNTGKVAFPYLHKILSQWHSLGIRTAQDAQREMEGGKRRDTAEASFDLGEIERVMQQNSRG